MLLHLYCISAAGEEEVQTFLSNDGENNHKHINMKVKVENSSSSSIDDSHFFFEWQRTTKEKEELFFLQMAAGENK